jgi:hypothetical protein
MKTLYFITSVLITNTIFSQQQSGNVYYKNNTNSQMQLAQTDKLAGNSNDDNNLSNQIAQQTNFMNHVEDNVSLTQNNSSKSSNGNSFSLSFNAYSRTSSSNSSSKFKSHKHAFNKKMHKFNRNFYGKMSAHKKSKHLVDVCFNWS